MFPPASSGKSPHGRNNGTPPAHASNGCSQPTRPAPKWAAPIPSRPKSHNHRAEVLAPAQQRAAVQAAACFLKTHVASVETVAIKLLSTEVVLALFEIEPNHRIGRAMPWAWYS